MGCLQQQGPLGAEASQQHGESAPVKEGAEPNDSEDATTGARQTEMRLHWHVTLLAALMDFGQAAMFRSSGFVYVVLMEHFNVDHGTASWPVSVLGTVVDAGGILAGPFCQWFGPGVTLKAGAVVTAVGVIASVFAPSIAWMTVTLGVLHGAGAGTVSTMLQVVLSMRFVKYRGTAHGIMFMGTILSSLIMPQVLFWLEHAYGFQGCLLVFGALLLNLIPLSFLLRTKPAEPSSSVNSIDKCIGNGNGQHLDIHIEDFGNTKRESSIASSSSSKKPGVFESARTILKLPMFYAILVTWTVMCYNEDIFLTTIVDFAVDKGVERHWAVPLLSYLSVTDAVGRIGLPLLADKKFIRRSTLVLCNAACTAISVLLLPHAQSYGPLVAVTLFVACFNGCGMTMHGVLMADYIGIDDLPVSYGVAGILVIPLLLVKSLLIGYFRDTLGSYDNLYRMLGGMQVVVCVLWLFITYQERRQRSSWSGSSEEESETRKPKSTYEKSASEDFCKAVSTPLPVEHQANYRPDRKLLLKNSTLCVRDLNSGSQRVAIPGAVCSGELVNDDHPPAKIVNLREPVRTTGYSNYGSVEKVNNERNSGLPLNVREFLYQGQCSTIRQQ